MRRVVQIVVLLAVLVGGGFVWRYLFPSPETAIKRQLAELEERLSFGRVQGDLTRAANAAGVPGMFTEDAEIWVDLPGQRRGSISGREQIRSNVMAVMRTLPGLEVSLLDVTVHLAADKASATVNATGRAITPEDPELGVQELKFYFKKTDEGWLISRVETVRTLTWQKGVDGVDVVPTRA